jgi:hypothetical protein
VPLVSGRQSAAVIPLFVPAGRLGRLRQSMREARLLSTHMRSCSPPPMTVGTVGTGSGQLGPVGVSFGGGWVVMRVGVGVGVGVGGTQAAIPSRS